jgi:hypothetical protein
VREAEHRGGQETSQGLRQRDAEEAIDGTGAERRSGFEWRAAELLEARLDRLHHERQRVEYRADDQTAEAEHQRPAAECALASHGPCGRGEQQMKPSTVGGSTSGSATAASIGAFQRDCVRATHQASGVANSNSSAVEIAASRSVSSSAARSPFTAATGP